VVKGKGLVGAPEAVAAELVAQEHLSEEAIRSLPQGVWAPGSSVSELQMRPRSGFHHKIGAQHGIGAWLSPFNSPRPLARTSSANCRQRSSISARSSSERAPEKSAFIPHHIGVRDLKLKAALSASTSEVRALGQRQAWRPLAWRPLAAPAARAAASCCERHGTWRAPELFAEPKRQDILGRAGGSHLGPCAEPRPTCKLPSRTSSLEDRRWAAPQSKCASGSGQRRHRNLPGTEDSCSDNEPRRASHQALQPPPNVPPLYQVPLGIIYIIKKNCIAGMPFGCFSVPPCCPDLHRAALANHGMQYGAVLPTSCACLDCNKPSKSLRH
jgi:hypothetical protein